MIEAATVEEIVPLVEALSPQERLRLFRLITGAATGDSSLYQAIPPTSQEFSTDEDPLAYEYSQVSSVGQVRHPL
jgi:hypothetical protein